MQGDIVSKAENDYNPFNISLIELNASNEFTSEIAFKGCPPFNNYSRAQFAKLSIEMKAAYADGVVRGSYQKEWMMNQVTMSMPKNINDSSVGAVAYVYLKTQNPILFNNLNEWCTLNRNNHTKF